MRLVGEAVSAAETVALIGGTLKPLVLVMDLPHAGQLGLDAITCIRALAPNLAILVFTAHSAAQYAIEALRLDG